MLFINNSHSRLRWNDKSVEPINYFFRIKSFKNFPLAPL
jgi:hypothetical protein